MKHFWLLLCAALPAWGGMPAEPGFTDTVFAGGLPAPTCLAWAPDGSNRLFVSLKEAGIGVIENGVLRTPLFATFPTLETFAECGVLGLAFDPDYLTNRFVYVFVTVTATEQRIIRFTDQDSSGTQRTNILTGLPASTGIHNGGALGFGPDGKLYFAIGDNGAKRGVDGNLTSLASKVGRANKDGSVPWDNPFFDGPGPRNDYIWATGFRNPFTLTFRPGRGELWLSVVGSGPDGQTEPKSGAGYEQIFVIQPGADGGYDDFEGNQPAAPRFLTPFPRPSIRPRLQYRTLYGGGGVLVRGIAGFARANEALTITTTEPHAYREGQTLVVSGTGSLDGPYTVQSVPYETQFTAYAPGEALTGAAGQVDALAQGACVTGGDFYESSGFPDAYRGNYFFGDLVRGWIFRTQLGPDGRPRSVTPFVRDVGQIVDVATGPDGALYYARLDGAVHRVASTAQPKLVVSPTTLSLPEGARGTFSVRLGAAPAGPVTVQVHPAGTSPNGPSGLELTDPGPLHFTPESWAQPQPVSLVAAQDDDSHADPAVFSVTAPGFEPVEVAAQILEQNLPPLVLSTNSVEVRESRSVALTVALSAAPDQAVVVRIRPGAGPRNRARVVRGAALRFTPRNWDRPQRIVIKGVEDADRLDHAVSFVARGPGYQDRELAVAVVDNDPSRPVFASQPVRSAVVARPYRYVAEARAYPDAAYRLVSGPAGLTVDAQTGAVEWTPAATGEFSVVLQAANRVGTVEQAFTIAVAADTAPVAFITAPADGAFVTGSRAEFFGGSLDDAGTWRAEFYIDGELAYTDENRQAHYHLGGAHHLFDTTRLTNGAHSLRLVVTDDAGQTGEATVQITVAN